MPSAQCVYDDPIGRKTLGCRLYVCVCSHRIVSLRAPSTPPVHPRSDSPGEAATSFQQTPGRPDWRGQRGFIHRRGSIPFHLWDSHCRSQVGLLRRQRSLSRSNLRTDNPHRRPPGKRTVCCGVPNGECPVQKRSIKRPPDLDYSDETDRKASCRPLGKNSSSIPKTAKKKYAGGVHWGSQEVTIKGRALWEIGFNDKTSGAFAAARISTLALRKDVLLQFFLVSPDEAGLKDLQPISSHYISGRK